MTIPFFMLVLSCCKEIAKRGPERTSIQILQLAQGSDCFSGFSRMLPSGRASLMVRGIFHSFRIGYFHHKWFCILCSAGIVFWGAWPSPNLTLPPGHSSLCITKAELLILMQQWHAVDMIFHFTRTKSVIWLMIQFGDDMQWRFLSCSAYAWLHPCFYSVIDSHRCIVNANTS